MTAADVQPANRFVRRRPRGRDIRADRGDTEHPATGRDETPGRVQRRACLQHVDTGDRCSVLDTVDDVAGYRSGRIALARHHHDDGRTVAPPQRADVGQPAIVKHQHLVGSVEHCPPV